MTQKSGGTCLGLAKSDLIAESRAPELYFPPVSKRPRGDPACGFSVLGSHTSYSRGS